MKFFQMTVPLPFAILLFTALFLQSCSSTRINAIGTDPVKKVARKKKSSRYDNFDKKSFPKDAAVISNMISIVQPELEDDQRENIASMMAIALKPYKIEPQIMVAIIDTESNFKPDKVSSTGDLSLAQINCEVWNKEFIRMKKEPISKLKIKTDQQYALSKMAEILNIIKTRYAKKDPKWYSRYHSNTKIYKKDYQHKLDVRMVMLAKSTDLATMVADNTNPRPKPGIPY